MSFHLLLSCISRGNNYLSHKRIGPMLFVFVCLLCNLFSIPEKSNNFLRWHQSLVAYLRNTRKWDSYHPWPVPNIVMTQFTREDGWFSWNNPLSYARPSSIAAKYESDDRLETCCIMKPPLHVTFSPWSFYKQQPQQYI